MIVGVILHNLLGHFVALRLCNDEWYICNDVSITLLSRQTNITFNDDIYMCDDKGFPINLVKTHATMVVYDMIH